MKVEAQAPTVWPAPAVLDAWWRWRVGTSLDRLARRPAAERRRTAGAGAAPGSRWEAVRPGGRGGSAEAVVTGTPDDRRLRATGRLAVDPGREAVLDVDGLDALRRVETSSRLRHLGWHAVLTARPDRLLQARLELDWLLVVVQAAVRPRAGAEQLEVRLVVRGRGAWRPVLAPVLSSVEGRVERRTAALVGVVARALARVADQPSPPPPPSAPTGRATTAGTARTGVGGPRATPSSGAARWSRPAADPPVGGLSRRGAGGVGGLDLSWLASPVTTVRHLRTAARRGRVRAVVDALRGWWTGPSGPV